MGGVRGSDCIHVVQRFFILYIFFKTCYSWLLFKNFFQNLFYFYLLSSRGGDVLSEDNFGSTFFLAVSSNLKWNEKRWMGCNCILIHSWEENCIWKNEVQKEEGLLSFDWLFFLWMMCNGPKNARCVIMKWKFLFYYCDHIKSS